MSAALIAPAIISGVASLANRQAQVQEAEAKAKKQTTIIVVSIVAVVIVIAVIAGIVIYKKRN